MSYFIANQISINMKEETFKVKGGDNNIVPRFNEWTNELPLYYILDQVGGGMVQLRNSGNEKMCFINQLVDKYRHAFGGDFMKETDYFHQFRDNTEKAREFTNQFLDELKKGLKNLSNKKEYAVQIRTSNYVAKKNRTSVYLTGNIHHAKLFSYHVAKEIEFKYSTKGAKVIKVETENK